MHEDDDTCLLATPNTLQFEANCHTPAVAIREDKAALARRPTESVADERARHGVVARRHATARPDHASELVRVATEQLFHGRVREDDAEAVIDDECGLLPVLPGVRGCGESSH
jgi:hypothetical protein